MKNKIKKNNYPQFIEKLYSEARSSRWKMFYDKESDSLFWTKRPIPSDNRLAKVAKEITFYLDNSGEVNGLIIRPFRNNFLSHNEEVLNVTKFFTNREKNNVYTIPQEKRREVEPFLATLSATIKKDIYKDAAEAKYPLQDLAKFLVSSSR